MTNAQDANSWFMAIHRYAREAIDSDGLTWRSACGRIMCAIRRAEELLQPFVHVEVFPADSDVFTGPTGDPSHALAPPSSTGDTLTQPEILASHFYQQIFGGNTEAKMQELEHALLELKVQHGNAVDHPEIAAKHHELGVFSREAGYLNEARQHLEESLRMNRSFHEHKDHPDVAVTLHELGVLSRQAGDLNQGKQYLEESLRMKKSWHGDKHPEVAATHHTLGELSRQAGDLKQAKQHLEESLQMMRSLHGDKDHPDVAATMHTLGDLSRQLGSLEEAKQHLEESLRMKRSLHGHTDHPEVAATYHALGTLSRHIGDFNQAKQQLEESLRMNRSWHGDKSNHEVAATFHALGTLSRQTGDFEQAKKHLEESFRMNRSLHGDKNHHDIAAILHELGILLSGQPEHFPAAKQHLEESLQMSRSLHGDRDHPAVAATLQALGILSRQLGDLEEAKQHLEECMHMQRAFHGNRDHPDVAVTLHELGVLSLLSGDTVDRSKAKQHLEESLQMMRSLGWDKNHQYIAKTMHRLNDLRPRLRDLKFQEARMREEAYVPRSGADNPRLLAIIEDQQGLAKEIGSLEESLQMNRSHVNQDWAVVATLQALGVLSRQLGDLEEAKRHLKNCLQMQMALQGDKDHPDVAVTLHELGVLSRHAGDLNQGKQYLEESLRMKKSFMLRDSDSFISFGFAATLHELGVLILMSLVPLRVQGLYKLPLLQNGQAGDLNPVKQRMMEILETIRSFRGRERTPAACVTLYELHSLTEEAGDLEQAKHLLHESLRMKKDCFSIHGYDQLDVDVTRCALDIVYILSEITEQVKVFFANI